MYTEGKNKENYGQMSLQILIYRMILPRQNPNKISEKDPSQGLQNVIKYSLLLHSYLKHTDLKSSTTYYQAATTI